MLFNFFLNRKNYLSAQQTYMKVSVCYLSVHVYLYSFFFFYLLRTKRNLWQRKKLPPLFFICGIGWQFFTIILKVCFPTRFFSSSLPLLLSHQLFHIVSHRSVWLSPEYENYIDFIFRKGFFFLFLGGGTKNSFLNFCILQPGGIYQHRWGDAPIKSVYLSTHVPLTKVIPFPF